jgi:hypothetical protein
MEHPSSILLLLPIFFTLVSQHLFSQSIGLVTLQLALRLVYQLGICFLAHL